MYLHLATGQFGRENQSSVCNYTNFLGAFTNLVELGGEGYFTRYLSIGIESCVSTLVLLHLKVIKLQVDFEDREEILVVARLIIGAPNLHKLQISPRLQCEVKATKVSFKDYFGFVPNFTLEKLKNVSLRYVCHYPTGMQLVKFLLETSPVLETMELKFLEHSGFHEVAAELLGFRRASPNARITII